MAEFKIQLVDEVEFDKIKEGMKTQGVDIENVLAVEVRLTNGDKKGVLQRRQNCAWGQKRISESFLHAVQL